jgi:hypothetical protein
VSDDYHVRTVPSRAKGARMRLDPEKVIPPTGQTVGDFWAWAYSDVDTNIMRAIYAEWLVGTALECVDKIRPSWTPWDLDYEGAKIEVKSTSYLPNWGQLVDGPRTHHAKEREAVEKRSPKSRTFDIKATTAQFPADPEIPFGPFADYYEDGEVKRRADVYVFAYYAEEDLEQYSSLDVSGWRFYVLSTPELERHFMTQDTVALSRIRRVAEEVEYGDLRTAFDTALDRARLEDS